MFTVLSFLLFIQILANGNLSNDQAAMMLFFGWELLIFFGLVLDAVVITAILLVIALIIASIIFLVSRSKKKKKIETEEVDGIMNEHETEISRRESHGQ